ncbi:hypothetical protein CEXT_639651 [Caerostris extrusa]|uniref:Uncharacterized protein n=1 Tax=Caerostris extrusa TaxID=172846 RepID=A0AAV4MH46_CAEEX|nr:hypothetical protein CEXT_639651 [Caerostris extrusa]
MTLRGGLDAPHSPRVIRIVSTPLSIPAHPHSHRACSSAPTSPKSTCQAHFPRVDSRDRGSFLKIGTPKERVCRVTQGSCLHLVVKRGSRLHLVGKKGFSPPSCWEKGVLASTLLIKGGLSPPPCWIKKGVLASTLLGKRGSSPPLCWAKGVHRLHFVGKKRFSTISNRLNCKFNKSFNFIDRSKAM